MNEQNVNNNFQKTTYCLFSWIYILLFMVYMNKFNHFVLLFERDAWTVLPIGIISTELNILSTFFSRENKGIMKGKLFVMGRKFMDKQTLIKRINVASKKIPADIVI